MTQQKGFSAIEILVAITVLAILAGGVWVWREQKTQKPSPAKISPEQAAPTAASEISPVAVSPQSKIAFVRDGDIWVINPDGSGERRLIDIKGYAQELSWSKDASMLTFLVTNTTNMASADLSRNVYLYRISNSDLRQLTNDSQNATPTYYKPQFSPNGTKIAVNTRAPDSGIIKILDETGAILQTINYNFFPRIPDSPSGLSAYAIFLDFVGWFDSDQVVISMRAENGYISFWRFNLVNQQTEKIHSEFLDGGLIETDPALSPDGNKITYDTSSLENDVPKSNLWIHDLKTNEVKKLASVDAFCDSFNNLQFSPDSQKILSLVGVGCGDANIFHVTDIESEVLHSGGNGFYTSVIWLDNKNIIAGVIRSITEATAALEIVNLNGDTVKRLTTNASQPAWQSR